MQSTCVHDFLIEVCNCITEPEASSQSTEKSRTSYNDWVRKKQRQELADAKKKQKARAELEAQSDPEMDKVGTSDDSDNETTD